MVLSWNLMSILMSDVTVSLKWLTVTFKIETAYRHGTNCILGEWPRKEKEKKAKKRKRTNT